MDEGDARVASVLTLFVCPIVPHNIRAKAHQFGRCRKWHAKQNIKGDMKGDREHDGRSHLNR